MTLTHAAAHFLCAYGVRMTIAAVNYAVQVIGAAVTYELRVTIPAVNYCMQVRGAVLTHGGDLLLDKWNFSVVVVLSVRNGCTNSSFFSNSPA